MNSQELMIGDWIRFSSEPYNFEDALRGKPVRVEGLRDEDGAIKVYERDTYYWSEDEDDFEPIPLTAEILKKNGWQEDDGWLVLKNGTKWNVSIAFHEDGYDIEIFGQNPLTTQFLGHLNYLHELQHILTFMKIRKEIEI